MTLPGEEIVSNDAIRTSDFAAADREWTCRSRVYADAGHAITVPYEAMGEDVLAAMGGTRDGTLYAATDAWERTLETLRDGLSR